MILQGMIPGAMIPTIEGAAAWLATYALHSTLLLGSVWLLVRVGVVRSPIWQDTLWKSALVGGIVTASLQLATGSGVSAFEIRVGSETDADVASATPDPSVADRPFADDADPAESWIARSDPHIDRHPDERRTSIDFDAAADRDLGFADADASTDRGSLAAVPVPSKQPTADAGRIDELAADATQIPAVAEPVWRRARSAGVAIWALVAFIAIVGLVRLRLALPRRLGRRRRVDDPRLVATLEALQRRAGIDKPKVRLTQSAGLRGPVAVGWSEICLPERALRELNSAQLESMLAHELAHVVRRDPAWLMIGAIVERLFFFQPLNRIGRHRMQENAEYLCDDWAVEHTGRRVTLAKCLAQVAGWIDRPARPALLAGMADSGPSTLVRRVTRLLERPARHRATPRPLRGLLATALLAAVVLAGPGVSAVVATPCPPKDQDACQDAKPEAPKPSLTGMITQDRDAREPLRLGINAEPIDPALAVHFGLEPDSALTVTAVAPGSVAQRSGLRVHDMILRVDGKTPVTIDSLRARIAEKRNGSTLRLRILRRGDQETINVFFGDRSDRRSRDRAASRAITDRQERGDRADRVDRRQRAIRDRGDTREESADRRDDRGRRNVRDRVDVRDRRDTRDRGDTREIEAHIAELSDELADVLSEIDGELEAVLMPHLELLDEQLAEFGPELQNLGPQIERAIAAHLREIEKAQPRIQAMVEQIEGLEEEELEEFVEEIEEIVEEIVEPEIERIEAIVEEIVEPQIERIEETIERRIEPEIDGFEQMIESVIDREVDKIERLIEKYAGDHEELLEHLHDDVIEPHIDHVHKIMDHLVEPRIEHFHGLLEALVEPEMEAVHEHLEHALHPILESLHEEIGRALERVHERHGHRHDHDHEHEHEQHDHKRHEHKQHDHDHEGDLDLDHDIRINLDGHEIRIEHDVHHEHEMKHKADAHENSKAPAKQKPTKSKPQKQKPAKKGVELIANLDEKPLRN